MDVLPIGFLLLLALISGAIALAADELGRKLGKKRLSIFGLRPKHTARLGTFTLGVVVSLFSILLVSLVSKDVRQWILEGRQAITDLNIKKEQLKQADAELSKSQSQEKYEQVRVRNLEDLQSKASFNLNATEIKLRSEQAREGQLREQADALNAEINRKNYEIQDKNRLISQTEAKRVAEVKKYEILSRDSARNLNASRTHSLELEEKQQQLAANISDQQKTLDQLNLDKGKLETDKAKLTDDLNSTKDALQQMTEQASQETENLKSLRLQAADLEAYLGTLENYQNSVVGPSRLLPMTFTRGQEVARLPVPDHLSKQEAETALQNLLKEASSIAETKGAKARATYHAADIMTQDKTAEERRSQIVRDLTDRTNPMVLVASADINAFEGEPVSVAVEVKENPFVFKKGEVVAESRIDGAKPAGDVIQAMTHFLGSSIRAKARERRMIGDFMEVQPVPDAEFWHTFDAIKSKGHAVELLAVAQGDTHAADALKLDLQVR